MKQSKFFPKDFPILLALILLGLLLAVGLLALNWFIARQFGAGADFLPAWNGPRAFLFENSDPYGRTIAELAQQEVYGRAARAGEYPFALDIPFPLLLVYAFPLFLYRLLLEFLSLLPIRISMPIPDASWTLWMRAAWMALSELGIGLLVFFSLRLADWAPRRWFAGILLAFALAWFFSISALLDGSFSIFLALALVGALLAMRDFHDELAGFLLAVSAMKWDLTFLPWVLLILAALTARRWRVFFGIGMTWFLLGAVAYLVYPGWFWPYARAAASNFRADGILTPARFMSDWFPGFGANLALLAVSILLLILVIEWFAALRGKDFRRVAWAFALAFAIAPLTGFSNTFANLAPLVFSFVFILPFAWQRWKNYPTLVLSAILILFFTLPLALQFSPISSPILADGLTFLLPPLLLIIGLYWIRWYVVRPPMAWLEGVKREVGGR